MYLLDTNVCIDFIDARNEAVRQRIVGRVPDGLSVSSITAAELLVGAKNSEDPKGDKEKAQRFLSIVRSLDFNLEAANAYVRIVEQLGVHRRSFDRLIAAHALALGLTLVTNNQKHFADVPGLKVENWTV
jgi:tRNA(fMet)-specific endonuclease VapC